MDPIIFNFIPFLTVMLIWRFYTLINSFFPIEILKWPPVYIYDVRNSMCKNTIIFFSMSMWWYNSLYLIHDDVIKHHTTGHNTSRIIITYILIFIGKIKWLFFKVIVLEGGKKSFLSGKNIFDLVFLECI